MADFPWLTVLMVVPLVGAVVLWAPTPARSWARQIAFGFALVELAVAGAAVWAFDIADAGTHQLTETYSWIAALGVSYALGVDGVGLALIVMSVLLVPLVVLAAWREQGAGRLATADLSRYLALALVLETFMVGVFAARDVFLFYLLFEAMLIPVYFMIGSYGGDPARRRLAALKFLLYSLLGGLVMLVGVVYLGMAGPDGDKRFLTESLTGLVGQTLTINEGRWLFLTFFVAFAIKAPMFPVHTWLPDAAEQAPAGTSALLVGVLDKVGTFGMLTLCLPLFPEASQWAAPVIIVFAVVSIIYGALLAIGQKNMFRLVAYTSVSHFGFIVLGIFAIFPLAADTGGTAVAGSSFYMVNHGLSTGALFLLVGFLVARRGSPLIADFGGLTKVVPVLAGLFMVVGLSALSLPGLSTFVSEFLVLVGTFPQHPAVAIVACSGVVLAAVYILWLYQRVFTGGVPDNTPEQDGRGLPPLAAMRDVRAVERWAVVPLIAVMLVLGFWPRPALDLVRPPADQTVSTLSDVL
ncbi:MAG: NADH-quinone oxidoreductase subunit M, partial [Micrococcales bacterium]|nr:NADH-quinone oxidoreductase subunit M [Micrococcales bacterium]